MKPVAVIVGIDGQDGQLLKKKLKSIGYSIVGITKDTIDITNPKKVSELISSTKPKEIYFLAAFHYSSEEDNSNENTMETEISDYEDEDDNDIHFTREQAGYDLILGVYPDYEQSVIAGGIDLYATDDGGSTWDQISEWWLNPGDPQYAHADQHNIIFRPDNSNTVLFANDGGLQMRDPEGDFTVKNSGYNVTQFYSAALHPQVGNNYFLAGSQDNGTQKFQNASGIVSTVEATGGDGGYCFIDQNDPLKQITSYVFNNYYGSEDGGLNFNDLTDPYVEDNTGRFINPSDYDANSQILYSASNSDYIKRTYGLNDAEHLFIDLDSGQASHIRVSAYTDNTIFIGTGSGKLFKFENANSNNPSRENIIGTNESDWDQTIATNLSGTYHLTKEIIPLMVKKNEGSIVNISSIAGITGMKERFSYSVSKSGLIGFTNSIATDFAKHNIRVNTICPGYIKTPLTEKYLNSLPKKEYLDLERKHPLMGFGKKKYITDVVDFLLSNKSAWITGSTIPVDGGYSLGRD